MQRPNTNYIIGYGGVNNGLLSITYDIKNKHGIFVMKGSEIKKGEEYIIVIPEGNKIYNPIPFALAPNKNTMGLRTRDSISSLLEIDLFLLGLIRFLSLLP